MSNGANLLGVPLAPMCQAVSEVLAVSLVHVLELGRPPGDGQGERPLAQSSRPALVGDLAEGVGYEPLAGPALRAEQHTAIGEG